MAELTRRESILKENFSMLKKYFGGIFASEVEAVATSVCFNSEAEKKSLHLGFNQGGFEIF